MRVIIAGSRMFTNYQMLKETCNHLFQNKKTEDITILSGTAYGADKLGERYAREHNIKLEQYPANWKVHGNSAGYKRNAKMAQNADACVVFWDGQSKGTKHMIDLAKYHQLDVRIVRY